MTESLDRFHKKYPPGKPYQTPAAEVFAKYKNILPDALLKEWREHGFCDYKEGFIWTVNPDEYANVLEEWVDEEKRKKTFVIARMAFGSLYLWHQGTVFNLNVHRHTSLPVADTIEDFLNFSLHIKDYIKTVLYEEQFLKAKERLGVLKHDECYAFVPALALGGSKQNTDTISKVKLFEHLSFLSQL